jgi:hypothetical protein
MEPEPMSDRKYGVCIALAVIFAGTFVGLIVLGRVFWAIFSAWSFGLMAYNWRREYQRRARPTPTS